MKKKLYKVIGITAAAIFVLGCLILDECTKKHKYKYQCNKNSCKKAK